MQNPRASYNQAGPKFAGRRMIPCLTSRTSPGGLFSHRPKQWLPLGHRMVVFSGDTRPSPPATRSTSHCCCWSVKAHSLSSPCAAAVGETGHGVVSRGWGGGGEKTIRQLGDKREEGRPAMSSRNGFGFNSCSRFVVSSSSSIGPGVGKPRLGGRMWLGIKAFSSGPHYFKKLYKQEVIK